MRFLRNALAFAGRIPLLRKPSKWVRKKIYAISIDDLYKNICSQEFEQLQVRFSDDSGAARLRNPKKYVLELRRILLQNLRMADRLGLYGLPPLNILDLGCGPGYFVRICQLLGHTATGVDIDTSTLFREVIKHLALTRVICRIEPFTPLPALENAPYDLITAFAICFNNHDSKDLWGPAEWNFFLNDIQRFLNPGASIYLMLNAEHGVPDDRKYYTPELKSLFLNRGAKIDGPAVTIPKQTAKG